MMDEPKEELAIAYFLGELSSEKEAAFEIELAVDSKLAAYVADLHRAAAVLASNLPERAPQPRVRDRVMEAVKRDKAYSFRRRLPVAALAALTACLALALVLSTQTDTRHRKQLAAVREQLAEKERLVASLQSHDPLTEVKIATLAPQAIAPPLAKANVVVVWDAAKQQGLIQLARLPKADAGKDYQLWVIDPQHPAPVSAGVLTLSQDGTVVLSFKPDQPVSAADKFAISVEHAGGVPKAAGPVVFVGGF